ncbi:pectate lyase [Verrucomicrobiaceae bacterium 227]
MKNLPKWLPHFKARLLVITTLVTLAGSPQAATRAENLNKKEDAWFRSNDGIRTLDNILSWQSKHGGWPKNKDTTSESYSGDRSKLQGTFDNGATTGELRILARATRLTKQARYEKAFLAGLDNILKAQYSNGGFPQYYPLRKGYYTRITFNDSCMIRIMEFLDEVVTSADYDFLDHDRRAAAKKASDLGIACILKCQIKVKGQLTVWCAQHDEITLAPAKARSYELVSLSGAESAGILRFLMSIDEPSPGVIRAVKAGAAWFEANKIEGFRYKRSAKEPALTKDPSAPSLWARFSEIETNRPFFCDRDGVKKYDLMEVGDERRKGYSWYSTSGEAVAKEFAKWSSRLNSK